MNLHVNIDASHYPDLLNGCCFAKYAVHITCYASHCPNSGNCLYVPQSDQRPDKNHRIPERY